MKTYAAILAAGSGTRFGGDKTQELLQRRELWKWSYEAFKSHPEVCGVLLVGSERNLEALRSVDSSGVVLGGLTRQESSRKALEALPPDAEAILIHDAARPFVTGELISRVIAGIRESGASGAGLKVTDTVKMVTGQAIETLDRARLVAMQTPQGARVDLLKRALGAKNLEVTDDLAALEAIGITPKIVEGDPNNFKVTTMTDLARARQLLGFPESRTGLGYDIHPFSQDPSRTLMLGGVAFPGHSALEGHSDADVVLHAITDAILGAASMGDIGVHFPNTEAKWEGADSKLFLLHAANLVRHDGWQIISVDVSLVAETPKVMKKAAEIQDAIAKCLEIEPQRVNLKATTNEKLGAIGRSEGIAAFAVATLREII